MARFIVKSPSDGIYLSCEAPEWVLQTSDPEEVPDILGKVEAFQKEGYYVAGYLSYEAASSFDQSLVTKPATDLPLVVMLGSRQVTELGLMHGETKARDFSPRIHEAEYNRCYKRLIELIHAGDIYQANYSFRVDLEEVGDGADLFWQLEHHHPVPYAAYLEFDDWQIVSSSPELFLQRDGNSIFSEPMKGTTHRGLSYEADLEQQRFLHNDTKNRAENVMIVDLMRNDLSKVCLPQSVAVSDLFSAKRFASLHQMISRVEGQLQDDVSLFELLRATFPAGSITGAPKVRAMQVIADLEADARNIYTGSIGIFFPAGDFQLNVAIRTLLLNQHEGSGELGIGSGVVSHSSAHAEWRECLLKGEFLNYQRQHQEIFETILWSGEFVFLEQHLERLRRSCEFFLQEVNLDEVRHKLTVAAEEFAGHDHRVRLSVKTTGEIVIQASPLSGSGWQSPQGNPGLKVLISADTIDASSPYQFHKTDCRRLYDQALPGAHEQGFAEVLFFNQNGHLGEGAISNIFVLVGGQWLTPALSAGILPGIWRAEMLKHLNAQEVDIDRDLLLQADRIMIGNSLRQEGEVEQLWSGGQQLWPLSEKQKG